MVESISVTVPKLYIPPPELAELSAVVQELSAMVQSVTVTVPALFRPPPLMAAVLPMTVQEFRVVVPSCQL